MKIDRKLIKFLYWLGLLIASLYGIGLLVGGFAVFAAIVAGFMRSGIVGILILASVPLAVLIYGIIAKVWLDTLNAILRMANQIEDITPQFNQEPLLAYCPRCRTKRPIQDPEPTVTKDGRSALRGTCPECGTNMFRFASTPSSPESNEEQG